MYIVIVILMATLVILMRMLMLMFMFMYMFNGDRFKTCTVLYKGEKKIIKEKKTNTKIQPPSSNNRLL